MINSGSILSATISPAQWLLVLQATPLETSANLEYYAKLVGGILAALGAAFGLPITMLQLRKTRAEIRKLELESATLEAKTQFSSEQLAGYSIDIGEIRADSVSFQVMVDPLLLGPMLLLLDFILIWVVLSLGSYAIKIFLDEAIGTVALGIIAAFLFVPLVREALHLKRTLKPKIQQRVARKGPTASGEQSV